ncbi:sel1 repeat family protein [Pelomyxa schiedti]|nr:sel1 repeat family protein [Pelomyxa schiedti]
MDEDNDQNAAPPTPSLPQQAQPPPPKKARLVTSPQPRGADDDVLPQQLHATQTEQQRPPCAQQASSAAPSRLAADCLGAWAGGETRRAYLMSLRLVLGADSDGDGGRECSSPQQLRSDVEQQREVYRRQLQLHNQQTDDNREGGPRSDDGNTSTTSTTTTTTTTTTTATAALGHIVWSFLIASDPRLLEPLWPLEAAVPDHLTATTRQPLVAQHWMVDFLESVAISTTGEGSEATSQGNDKCGDLQSLAHFLLGVALSREYGPWPFTDKLKSVEHINIAADRGDQRAQYWRWSQHGNQGDAYFDDLRKSASQGYCPAIHALGHMYKDVDSPGGVPLNRAEGLRLLQVGAEKGSAWCQFELAAALAAVDKGDALRRFKIASDQGLSIAQYIVARALCSPVTSCWMERNVPEALRLLKLSAAQGLTDSYTLLGMIFKNGDVVERNYKSAVEYLLKAANSGDAEAQFELAQCYLEGNGVEKEDEAEAFRLLQQALEGGMVEAHVQLGMMYLEGNTIVQQDITKASHHFQLAVQKDWRKCTQACFFLSNFIFRGVAPGTTRDAMDLLRKSTASMMPESFIGLGEVHENGVGGVTKDVREAVRCYRLAVASLTPNDSLRKMVSDRLKVYLRRKGKRQ